MNKSVVRLDVWRRILGPKALGSSSHGQPHRGKALSLYVYSLRHPPGDEEVNVKGLEPFHGVAVRSTRILGSSHFVGRP